MKFFHAQARLKKGQGFAVSLTGKANVRIMDDINFSNYQRGQSYRCTGGVPNISPVTLGVPSDGHWHCVVDLQGFAHSVNCEIKLVV